ANTGIPVCDINSLAFVGNSIFAGSGNQSSYWGNYISTNNGASWSTKNEGLGWVPPVLAYMVSSTYIYAGTGAQVIRRNLSEFIGIRSISTEIPSAYSLSQNYPNPFNPRTVIRFQLSVVGLTALKIYDIMGREIQTLVNEKLQPGTYEATFDGSNLSSGTYFYKLTSGDFSATKKLTLLK
ncbi:MAG: T9SS type A sorting domain-containing protein, partial [Ignavibacteriota bacterium]